MNGNGDEDKWGWSGGDKFFVVPGQCFALLVAPLIPAKAGMSGEVAADLRRRWFH